MTAPGHDTPHSECPQRGLTRRWSWRDASTAPPDATLTQRVLAARGLIDPAEAAAFLDPKLTRLHDPSLIPDLDKAAARLLDALDARHPIVIYGDYDADGITATAILYHTLRALAPDAPAHLINTYVPHRLDEGYGLNVAAIEQLAREGARVIVSVDCGITAIEPARAARAAGVDLIITDHHNPPATIDELPAAFAVVHPRRPDSQYPFGDLCGAGVAFKLAWRLATMRAGTPRVSPELRSVLVEMLAFAALGSIADVVPLAGENRILTRHGLERIKHSPLVGLRALVEASGMAGEKVRSTDVGFRLAPRLNACGRLAHAREAVELFTTADADRAAVIAAQLTALNDERRRTERVIFEQACEAAERAGMTGPERRAILLADERWHAGVVGIVCSRLVERYGRPAILLAALPTEREAHGSGRSVDGFNLHGALTTCADLLTRFGGHDMAAGLRVPLDRLPELVERFTAAVNAGLSADDLIPRIHLDAETTIDELTPRTISELETLAPCGRGNPEPLLALRNLVIESAATPMGQQGQHLAFTVKHDSSIVPARKVMRLVAWNWGEGDRRTELRRGRRLDAAISPRVSTWNGRTSVEPEVNDVALLD